MLIVVIPLALGFLLGFLRRGRLGRLAEVKFRARPLLFGSLGAQLVVAFGFGERLESGTRFALILASYLGVALFLLLNLAGRVGWVRIGLALISAGWLLNVIPITLNGGMPVSVSALREARVRGTPDEDPIGFFKQVTADESTRARWLGDVIPLRPIRQVVSGGDLLLALGIMLTIAGGMGAREAPAPRVPV